jgi:4-aminobutyrate aminotransferase/(S)-3-amino-2-methylpropionate transaminase
LAKRLSVRAAERGLILLTCGIYGNVIRILVPLIAPLEFVDEGMSLLEQSLGDIAS